MVRQFAVVVGKWSVENFRLVVLMSAFEHRPCEHMVLPVQGCKGRGLALSLL